MIAYNSDWLDRLSVLRQVDNMYKLTLINDEERKSLAEKYATGFYSPPFFLRLGLFLLTVIVILFCLVLFALLFLNGDFDGIGVMLLLFAAVCYGALEWIVQKKHFRSGIDDGLLWMSGILLVAGVNMIGEISPAANASLAFLISLFYTLRFMNKMTGALCCLAFLSMAIFQLIDSGLGSAWILSLLVMLIAGIAYAVLERIQPLSRWRHYSGSVTVGRVVFASCFYLAGNFFMVREGWVLFFNLTASGINIPITGWVFWMFTAIAPLAYIIAGMKRKQFLLIRVGLVCLALSILTFRHYYSTLPVELAMTSIGAFLILASFFLIRFFSKPRFGFIFKPVRQSLSLEEANAEGLALTEVMAIKESNPEKGPSFGGGSGGGGGASGEF